jgi:plasmid stabilization system protein ParE
MKRIEFHSGAAQEFVEAQRRYRERSDVAAQAFALEIDRAIRSLTDAPERWPEIDQGERRFVLSRFPYSILYRVRSDAVFMHCPCSPEAAAGLLA